MASLLLPSCGFSQKHSPSLACSIPRRRLQRDSPILLIGWQARKGRRITADSVVRGVSSSASTSSYPTSFASSAGPVVFRDLDADDFRHPLDKQNTLLLRAIPGLNEFGKALLGPVSEQIMLLENIGTSVLVADNQLPDIYQLLVEAAKILNVEAPDVYIRQNPVPNAYTLAISGRKPFIVVHTSLVELLNRKELQAVLAHELGHLKCDHGLWLTFANILTLGAYAVPGLGGFIAHSLEEQLYRWLRAAELTCDRAALLVTQDPKVKFWHGVEEILRACQPILQVLRLVDGDEKPAMGYLYAAMELARGQIIANFNSRQTKYQAILKIVDKRWKDQMNRPLHEAGFFLNPKLYFEARQKDACGVTKFGSAFMRCLEKMETDKDVQDKIGDQMMMYSCARGSFGNPMAIRARERRLPTDWWLQYGVDTPELQSFALRILGLCCSSSGCERNWSVFEFIHTKKRNRLEHKRLNDLVFVQYNRRLRERFNERKNHPERYDPICLEELDWGSSWMTKDGQDLVHDGEDLTWADVDQAMGASLERIRRGKMNMIATSSQSTTMGDDEDEELLEEEDEDTNDDDGGNWEESNGEEDEDYGGGEKASDMGEKELENAMFGFRI